LKQLVGVTPDATREEIREHLPVKVCLQTISNALIKLKLVYKKQRKAAEQHRPDIG
jgi:transposase